uniref:EGF-like domain-containing protein n=1 Tax=Rhabditophanes sp. KR3021 TaxID=114890 RepID=A0AC35UBJ2_9BILA
MCENNGVCYVTSPTLATSCTCVVGWMGATCSEKDPCVDILLKPICARVDSKAICDQKASTPTCTCSSGYTGTRCQWSKAVVASVMASYQLDPDGLALLDSSSEQPSLMSQAIPYLIANEPEDIKSSLSWSIDDLFEWIAFDENTVDLKTNILKVYNPVLGNCYTFNHKNLETKFKSVFQMESFGYETLVRMNSGDMMPWVESAYIIVMIHNSNQEFFHESIKYKAKRNQKNMYLLNRLENVRKGRPYSNCITTIPKSMIFYFDGVYSQHGCYKSCYLHYVNKKCGCQDGSYLKVDGLNHFCGTADKKCVAEVMETKGDPFYWKECKCPLACNELQYDVVFTMAPFLFAAPECLPGNAENLGGIRPFDRNCQARWQDKSWIHVTMIDVVRKTNVEKAKYSFSQILGQFGAISGSLIGASVLTILELIVFCLRFTRIIR